MQRIPTILVLMSLAEVWPPVPISYEDPRDEECLSRVDAWEPGEYVVGDAGVNYVNGGPAWGLVYPWPAMDPCQYTPVVYVCESYSLEPTEPSLPKHIRIRKPGHVAGELISSTRGTVHMRDCAVIFNPHSPPK